MSSSSESRCEIQHVYPLSCGQRQLWFLSRLDSGNPAYNLSMAWRCSGPVDPEALQWALNEVIRRHEILRTHFIEADGIPSQIVRDGYEFELPVVDCKAEDLPKVSTEHAGYRFVLEEYPAIRGVLIRLAGEEYVLQLTMHHILADGWSLGLLLRETVHFYEAYMRGVSGRLKVLPIQYGEFAANEFSASRQAEFKRQVRYWRERLLELPLLELPTDRVRPMVPSHRGGSVAVEFPAGLSRRLKELAQGQGVTLFMVLLAGFQLLLSRWSGKQDVVVGTDVANRNRAELEQLIGFFVNQLVLRTEVSRELSVGQFLGRVREVCLGAYAHQELPFERLVEELNPERSLGRTPLFQVKLILQNAPMPEVEPTGIHLEAIAVDPGFCQFDLSMSVWNTGEKLAAQFMYATDLYESSTVERMAGHWLTLLEGMASDAGRKVGELEMLSESERQQAQYIKAEKWNSLSTR
jgi:hypothetical protein